MGRLNIKVLGLIILAIIVVAGLGGAGYFYSQSQSKKPQDELTQIIKKVGELVELPAGEAPTLATVSDVSKLASQTFFQRAQNGDKVLIYTNAKKAYLYRPSTNKIIEIGPINDQAQAEGSSSAQVAGAQSQPSPTPAPEITLALFNGTKTSGLANKSETQLKKDFPNLKVMTKTNAKNDYEKTVVVALENSAKSQASEIAKKLNAEVKDKTPEGEYPPAGADILIFLGADRT